MFDCASEMFHRWWWWWWQQQQWWWEWQWEQGQWQWDERINIVVAAAAATVDDNDIVSGLWLQIMDYKQKKVCVYLFCGISG